MADGQQQKELFEFEKPRKIFGGLGKIFPKTDFENKVLVTVTLDRLIFVAIALIMVAITVYAVGIERGRALAKGAPAPPGSSQEAASKEALAPKKTIAPPGAVMMAKAQGSQDDAPARGAAVNKIAAPAKTAQDKDADKPYIIVAATFSKRDAALMEAERLKRNGFNSFVRQSDTYFQACAGAYSSKEGAKSELLRARRLYKDAYIKLN